MNGYYYTDLLKNVTFITALFLLFGPTPCLVSSVYREATGRCTLLNVLDERIEDCQKSATLTKPIITQLKITHHKFRELEANYVEELGKCRPNVGPQYNFIPRNQLKWFMESMTRKTSMVVPSDAEATITDKTMNILLELHLGLLNIEEGYRRLELLPTSSNLLRRFSKIVRRLHTEVRDSLREMGVTESTVHTVPEHFGNREFIHVHSTSQKSDSQLVQLECYLYIDSVKFFEDWVGILQNDKWCPFSKLERNKITKLLDWENGSVNVI